MNYSKLIWFLFPIIVLSVCSPQKESISSINVILFNKTQYEPTRPDDIKIYDKRITIPEKFFEIGTIKSNRTFDDNEIKAIAAEKGAQAILREGGNFILIRFKEKPKENKNEEITT